MCVVRLIIGEANAIKSSCRSVSANLGRAAKSNVDLPGET